MRDSCKTYLIGTYTLNFSQGQLWQTSMQVGVPVNESAKLNQVCNIVCKKQLYCPIVPTALVDLAYWSKFFRHPLGSKLIKLYQGV